MSDIKYQLRKMGYPKCAKDSLQITEQLIIGHTAGRTVISNSMALVNEIIAEFVFCERNTAAESHGNHVPSKNLNSIQELQLLEVLCSYFSQGNNTGPPMIDAVALRNAVFACLFPVGSESRSAFLVKLVSMAVATRAKHVLTAAGTWLQKASPTNPSGLALARSIVSDYLVLVPEAVNQLHDLPRLAPEFTSYFLSAVAELYGTSGNSESVPPPSLLKVVALWATKSPVLCTGALAGPTEPPFLGLVRWCVLAPLCGADTSDSYSQLHLALLESVLLSPRDQLVSAQQLAALVSSLTDLLPHPDPAIIKLALDRLTQTIIVLLRTGNVSGNILDLFQQMESLPKSELLEDFGQCRNFIIAPPYFRHPPRT